MNGIVVYLNCSIRIEPIHLVDIWVAPVAQSGNCSVAFILTNDIVSRVTRYNTCTPSIPENVSGYSNGSDSSDHIR